MEDQPALLKLLVSENKVLFEENETFRKEFETVQQQLEVKEQLYCECQNALEASKTQCTHLTEKCTHWEGVARRKTQKYSVCIFNSIISIYLLFAFVCNR